MLLCDLCKGCMSESLLALLYCFILLLSSKLSSSFESLSPNILSYNHIIISKYCNIIVRHFIVIFYIITFAILVSLGSLNNLISLLVIVLLLLLLKMR